MTKDPVGKAGLGISLAVCAAMCVAAFTTAPGSPTAPHTGLCFPPPEEWGMTPFASWLANMLMLLICTGALWMLNRRHMFVQSTGMLLPAAFAVLTASVPADVQGLSAGTLLAVATLISLGLLFGCRENTDNTQPLFVIASILSLGSALQAAFIPFAAVFLLAGIAIKRVGIREFLAYILGLAAPYWALFGLGIVAPADIAPQNPFSFPDDITPDLFATAGTAAVTAVWTLLAGFSNSMRLLKANSTVRAFNLVIALIGLTAMLGCIFNFSSLTVFLPTLFIASATQLANAFALRQGNASPVVPLLLLLIYIAFFLLAAQII